MSYQHHGLASGRWAQMTLLEQMANIGSEIERALNWRLKHNNEYSQKAYERGLELIDLSLATLTTFPRLRELARLREVVVDHFSGNNEFGSTPDSLKKYFLAFNIAARKDR